MCDLKETYASFMKSNEINCSETLKFNRLDGHTPIPLFCASEFQSSRTLAGRLQQEASLRLNNFEEKRF